MIYVSLSVCLSAYLSVSVSIFLSVIISVCLSVSLSACESIGLSTHQLVSQSVCQSLSVCPSICLSVYCERQCTHRSSIHCYQTACFLPPAIAQPLIIYFPPFSPKAETNPQISATVFVLKLLMPLRLLLSPRGSCVLR